ncbi:MAG: hypothetical protein ABJK39_15485 [Hyphomicrobiales bacterium]
MTSFFWIAAGAILVVSGFAYDLLFAGLPYQDPSPEIQASWIFHKGVAESIMVAGVTVLGIGCIWKAFQWIMRLLGRQKTD